MATINRSALQRKSAGNLLNKIKERETKKDYSKEGDKDFWQPTVDTSGNGFAVIRFLPAQSDESLPYVKQYNHGFKVGNKWFINNCPTTIGLPSPAVEHCNELWDTGLESDKKIARERKRKLRYIANVLVIKDPKNPENEGKVFKFGFGAKIFEKLMAVINPPEEYGEESIDPFSFFDGCNVKLKVRIKDGYRNYDETTVDKAPDLFGGDEDKLTELLEQLHDIDSEVSPDKFKDYDTLKKELMRVIGENIASEDSPVARDYEDRKRPERSTEYNQKPTQASKPRNESAPQNDADEDDDLAMFASLASDD